MLVKHVTLTPIDVPRRETRVQILWDGEAISDFTVERPKGVCPNRTECQVVERIAALVEQGLFDMEIAAILNKEGCHTSMGNCWKAFSVAAIRRRRNLKRPHARPYKSCIAKQRDDGLFSIHGVADRLGVPERTVRYWIESGQLHAEEGGGRGRELWFRLDRATLARLHRTKQLLRRSQLIGGL